MVAAGNGDRGVADGAAVNGKRGKTGCAGMGICPLPVIWTRALRPPQVLKRLQCQIIHLPCPCLQEGHPRHIVSQ